MEDDDIALPADTLAILNEFLSERTKREADEEQRVLSKTGTDVMFEEDWQLSQFWYSQETKHILRDVVRNLVKEHGDKEVSVALLSCPSLYKDIKDIHENVYIFEYDRRFEAFGTDFVYYDFNCIDQNPEYLKSHHNCYDLIIADPPFLSQECMTKMSEIILKLQRNGNTKVIFCSGEIVEPWLTSLLPVKKCKFRPQHERNLGNEFVSYANFNLDNYTVYENK